MRHLFIVNPVAGGKRNRHKEAIEHIRTVMSKQPDAFEIYVTTAPMDACSKIRLEAENCAPLRVYACGGDGTLNECVNGAAGLSHVAVTPYPIGTGNDFVKMFGKDAKKFRSLPALLQGFEHPIDLIDCNGRYGINICSIGIDARIGTDVHKYSAIPVIGGATGYVVSLVVNLIRGVNQPLKITANNMHLESSFALVCACNGRFYGGGFNPVPEAMPDDGIIDFLIVRAVSRLKFLRVVGKYAKGQYRKMTEIISHVRGNHMSIESEKELAVNIDGELLHAQDITFRTLPGGVNVIFPYGMKFFDLSSVSFAVRESNREI